MTCNELIMNKYICSNSECEKDQMCFLKSKNPKVLEFKPKYSLPIIVKDQYISLLPEAIEYRLNLRLL